MPHDVAVRGFTKLHTGHVHPDGWAGADVRLAPQNWRHAPRDGWGRDDRVQSVRERVRAEFSGVGLRVTSHDTRVDGFALCKQRPQRHCPDVTAVVLTDGLANMASILSSAPSSTSAAVELVHPIWKRPRATARAGQCTSAEARWRGGDDTTG